MSVFKQAAHLFGRDAEDWVQVFLTERGFCIIERNFRLKFGEIDIIALERDVVCFIEVKARRKNSGWDPLESVTLSKQRIIRKVAEVFLARKGWEDRRVRFDVVSVLWNTQESYPELTILRQAF